MNEAKILLMFASKYEIQESNQSGVSVEYYFWGENGETFNNRGSIENGAYGVRRAKANLPVSAFVNIVAAPAIYNGTFEIKIGSDGKPVTNLVSLVLDDTVDVSIAAVPLKDTKTSK